MTADMDCDCVFKMCYVYVDRSVPVMSKLLNFLANLTRFANHFPNHYFVVPMQVDHVFFIGLTLYFQRIPVLFFHLKMWRYAANT